MKRLIAGVATVTLLTFIFAPGFADEIPPENPEVPPEPPPIEEPALPARVFFSEIAWMGTAASANDEWMELYNAGEQAVDLSGWSVRNADGSLNAALSGVMEVGAYFLLERTDDTTISDISADQIYTGALKNDGEPLSLIDPLGQIVDQVDCWHAGNNTAKATMERADFTLPGTDPLAWATHAGVSIGLDANANPISGTPKSGYTPAPPPEEPPADPPAEPPVDPPPALPPPSGGPPYNPSPVYPSYQMINEVMVNPFGNDEQGEWVELYNATGQSLDLSGWYLDDAEGASFPFQIPSGTIISPGQYLVFREPGLGLSFKNSADIVRLLDSNKEPKETITYSDAKENYSYAKNSEGIFTWTPIFTPGSANQLPAPPKSYDRGTIILLSALPNPDGPDAGNEKIKLLSRSAINIDLAGWRIENGQGHSYRFADGSLSPQEERILLQDQFQFTLKNSSEILRLFDSAGNLIDEMGWGEVESGQWVKNYNFLPDSLNVFVTRVVDGDTFIANFESREVTIRLIGVDTPETVHPRKAVEAFGKEASDYLKQLLFGKNAILQFDANRTDKYGRLLAYVHSDGGFANELIVRQGYGYTYTRFPFKYLDQFVQLEQEAKKNGLGIWKMPDIAEAIKKESDNEREILNQVQDDNAVQDDPLQDENTVADLNENPAFVSANPSLCQSSNLKIDSIFPNAKKGEGVEYIRLTNTGSDKVCLDGWRLDDTLGGGSKPFSIKGGSVGAGAMRTFRKDETKIALNNSNDCAFLIDPAGQIADQICYGKTHRAEIFTHLGGDYKTPAPKVKTKAAKVSSVKRDPVLFSSALSHQTAVGRIQKIDETEEKIYVQLNGGQIIPLAYADSPVDIAMAKSLIDLGDSVIVDYRPGDTNQLLSLSQTAGAPVCPAHSNNTIYGFLVLAVLGNMYWLKRFITFY